MYIFLRPAADHASPFLATLACTTYFYAAFIEACNELIKHYLLRGLLFPPQHSSNSNFYPGGIAVTAMVSSIFKPIRLPGSIAALQTLQVLESLRRNLFSRLTSLPPQPIPPSPFPREREPCCISLMNYISPISTMVILCCNRSTGFLLFSIFEKRASVLGSPPFRSGGEGLLL